MSKLYPILDLKDQTVLITGDDKQATSNVVLDDPKPDTYLQSSRKPGNIAHAKSKLAWFLLLAALLHVLPLRVNFKCRRSTL